MPKTLSKTLDELWLDILAEFNRKHPGPFSVEALVDYALQTGRADLPRVDARRLLIRLVRKALRSAHWKDSKGRKVRELLPARFEHTDSNGNLCFRVMWADTRSMSYDHAARTFGQRDENIRKQRAAATRDLESCLENNPNLKGKASQLIFEFMLPTERTVEVVRETPRQPR